LLFCLSIGARESFNLYKLILYCKLYFIKSIQDTKVVYLSSTEFIQLRDEDVADQERLLCT